MALGWAGEGQRDAGDRRVTGVTREQGERAGASCNGALRCSEAGRELPRPGSQAGNSGVQCNEPHPQALPRPCGQHPPLPATDSRGPLTPLGHMQLGVDGVLEENAAPEAQGEDACELGFCRCFAAGLAGGIRAADDKGQTPAVGTYLPALRGS